MSRADHPIDQLRALHDDFRHARGEQRRVPTDSALQRSRDEDLATLEARLEALLERWIEAEDARQAWREHVRDGGPEPADTLPPTLPVFKGRAASGSRAEMYPAADGSFEVLIDGSLAVRLPSDFRLGTTPHAPVRIADQEWDEVIDTPDEALAALRDYLNTPQQSAPWQWARALFADGLINVNFGLTPRGQRVIRSG